ncbi:MAG: response regulator transcription factor [Chloroflexota bacterium]|nr:response regulator transcription factor [Chloroflexota bacterium]
MDVRAADEGPSNTIRVLIADDHPLFRAGVRQRLADTDPSIEVVGEAGDGREAVELAGKLHPDVVLMDVSMPGENGIEATKRIKTCWPDVSILALTVYDDEAYVAALLEAGAAGYLLKTIAAADLAQAIRRVHDGEPVLSPSIARAVLRRFTVPRGSAAPATPWGVLSEREMDVLRLAARGISNKEIAQELGLSVRTVHAHLSRMFSKLGVASRTEAVVYGLRHGWLLLDDLP